MSTKPGEQRAENGRELISRRAFARLKNWAPSYVVKLCQQGVLTVFIDCPACGSTCNTRAPHCTCGEAIADVVDASRGKVDAVLAERELERHKHPEKEHVTSRHAQSRGETPPGAPVDGELPLGDDNVVSYAQSKAKREEFQAKLAELDYMKRTGVLGELESMHREGFRIGRQVRESLVGICAQLAPVVTAERDEARVHALLLENMMRVCDEFYRALGGDPGTTEAAG